MEFMFFLTGSKTFERIFIEIKLEERWKQNNFVGKSSY